MRAFSLLVATLGLGKYGDMTIWTYFYEMWHWRWRYSVYRSPPFLLIQWWANRLEKKRQERNWEIFHLIDSWYYTKPQHVRIHVVYEGNGVTGWNKFYLQHSHWGEYWHTVKDLYDGDVAAALYHFNNIPLGEERKNHGDESVPEVAEDLQRQLDG